MAALTDRQLLIRLASILPVGSEERRVVLAGCEKLKVPAMRENCEKSKKDGVQPGKGKSKSKSKGDDKMPAELLEKFKAKKKAKTARLMKRQEKILRQYLDSASSPVMDYDKLSPQIQNALRRVKDQETLRSDVDRWLSDNAAGSPWLTKSVWASNRPALIRLASSLPVGSDERGVILAMFQKEARGGWDAVISGPHMRVRYGDHKVMIEEMPGKPVKRKVRRITFSTMWTNRSQAFHPGGPFLMVNIWRDAGITKNMSFDQAVKAMWKALDEAGTKGLKEAAKLSIKYPKMYQTPAEMQAVMDKIRWPKNTLSDDSVVSFLEVEPEDYAPISFKGKDFAGTSRWDEFTFYDEADKDDYMAQMEGMRAFYQSKSKGAARKLFKLLKADSDVVRNMDSGDFLMWLNKNKVGHRYVPTVWR